VISPFQQFSLIALQNLLQRMEQLENELKTLKAQGIAQASSKQQSSQSNTRNGIRL
jgi:hypothetical protein